ncbi:MAG: mycofactocin biosynthesis chaperone MftB [Sandaracinaceae bacterium]
MELDRRYALSEQAVLRHEGIGGLAYRYDNRRLYFHHSKPLVDFLLTLDGASPLGPALGAFLAERGLPEASRGTFTRSLERLEALEVVREL